MKKFALINLFGLLLLLQASQASGQNLIAVQNGNTPAFFINLDSAIVHALDGDTIYIPGGNFSLNTNISKRLHIIGAGYHPDSAKVTNPTNINVTSSLNLVTGASSGSLMGVKLNGDLEFGTSTANANVCNYIVGRCYVGCVFSNSSNPTNNLFFENILTSSSTNGGRYYSINMSFAKSNCFFNNIITGGINGDRSTIVAIGAGSVFKNNIFINSNPYYYLMVVESSAFENNIFTNYPLYDAMYQTINNIFNNNIFVTSSSYFSGTNTGSNNITNQPQSSIWINQSGDSFSYTQDYHLQPTSPGKNAGRDGTDIGIYGGAYPWKEGAIPSNPHFQSLKIDPTTDTNGNLNVKIKVAAQDH